MVLITSIRMPYFFAHSVTQHLNAYLRLSYKLKLMWLVQIVGRKFGLGHPIGLSVLVLDKSSREFVLSQLS